MATDFSVALAPVATPHKAKRPIVRPVSQVSLELVGSDAFVQAISECVAWIAKRASARIPSNAFSGEPFDLTDAEGAHWAAAARIAGEDASVWAARLDFHDKTVPQRTWLTEISVGRNQNTMRFGARLTNVTRGEDRAFTPSIPGIVKQLADRGVAYLDGRLLSNRPTIVAETTDGYSELLDFLEDKRRQASLILISQNEDGTSVLDADDLANQLCGAAHVAVITPNVSWQLTKDVGRAFSVYNGAVRHCKPGLSFDESNPFDHELFLWRHGISGAQLLDRIVRSVLQGTFTRPDADVSALRFEQVRRASLVSEASRHVSSTATAEDIKADLAEQVKAIEAQVAEDAAASQQLLDEAAAEKNEAEAKLHAARDQNEKLRRRIEWLEHALKQKGTEAITPLESYDDIGEWVDKHLSGSIIVLPRAIRETVKNGNFRDLSAFQEALLLLKDFYVPMRRGNAEMTREAFEARCRELRLEESACFSQPNDIKAFSQYWVPYGSGKEACDRHLKYGGGTDPRNMFRVYFFWDDEEQVVVIGHMPTHLPNWKTN